MICVKVALHLHKALGHALLDVTVLYMCTTLLSASTLYQLVSSAQSNGRSERAHTTLLLERVTQCVTVLLPLVLSHVLPTCTHFCHGLIALIAVHCIRCLVVECTS